MKNVITYLALSAFLVVIGCSLATAQGMMHKEEALPIIENISGMYPILDIGTNNLPGTSNDGQTIGPANPNSNDGGFTIDNVGGTAVQEIEVSVYPNPAKNRATIEVDGAAEIQIEIFNVIGQVVKVEQTLGGLIVINLDDVSAGIYLVRVKSDVGESVRQIRVVK